MGTIEVGAARVTITPPVGMYLPGMERTESSHGLRDDVFATALVFSNGDVKAAVASCDVLALHPDFIHRVRAETSALTGIPPENMMFCATHCHSSGITFALPDSSPMIHAYSENLAYQLIGLIRMAHDRLAPATLGYRRGQSNIGINRRLTREDGVTVIAANREGPVDPEVGVLRIDTADGDPLAVMVNYACHPVVLGNGSNVISSDWPGAMRQLVEVETGATCMFIQGACADINPLPGEPSDSEEVLEKLGAEIGNEVIGTWASIETKVFEEIAVASERIQLPLLTPSDYEGKLPQFVELAEASEGMSWDDLQAWLNQTVPWKAEIVGEGDDSRAVMELQAIRIGNTAVVSAAGEIFAQTGLNVKQRSPIANTMFAAYTNGLVCYIPPEEEYPRGGYEVDEVYIAYRLPSPPAPEASQLVEDTAVQLLAEVTA
jgi:neutral ceramidase